MTFDIIKRNYDRKLWNKEMVAIAVVKKIITDVQYKEITNDEYVAPSTVPQSTVQMVAGHDSVINAMLGVV